MTEYITKEQAINVVNTAFGHIYDSDSDTVSLIDLENEIVATIDEHTEPADVVEVVRCEDCKHRVVDEILLSFTSVPESAWVCDIGTTACLTGFYCKRGERKDGQQ